MKARFFTMALMLVAAAILTSGPVLAGKKKAMIASSLENESETQMSLESWMTSALLWNPGMLPEMISFHEEGLTLEEWMVNPAYWQILEEVQDSPLTMQAWMTHPVIWTNQQTGAESMLVLEGWMTDQDFWEKPCPVAGTETDEALKLESWMVSNDIWRS